MALVTITTYSSTNYYTVQVTSVLYYNITVTAATSNALNQHISWPHCDTNRDHLAPLGKYVNNTRAPLGTTWHHLETEWGILGHHLQTLHCGYILFSVLFQTKSSLVWKSYTQTLQTIFQTNSSLVWKEKK